MLNCFEVQSEILRERMFIYLSHNFRHQCSCALLLLVLELEMQFSDNKNYVSAIFQYIVIILKVKYFVY